MNERSERYAQLGCGVDHEQAEVGGDQFVPASAGMKFPTERAKLVNQGAFDEVMDVFCGGTFEELGIGCEFLFESVKSFEGVAEFDVGEDCDFVQGFGPGAVDRELVGQQPAIEGEGALEGVEALVRFALEAA